MTPILNHILVYSHFGLNRSFSMQSTDQAFSIQYATGAVYGNLAYDTLNIGGIKIPNQALGMVYQAGKELLQSSCDGIIVSHTASCQNKAP